MPRAPMIGTSSWQGFQQVPDEYMLMAAAMMHDEGRLVEPAPDVGMKIDEKDIQRDPDVVGEPIRPGDRGNENKRFDERYPDLERDKERDQRGIDREKRMRERQEEFEGDTFRMRRR